ncbi:DUF2267 domain-containing protein [Haloprofundus salilacus]|uniref:DUF2267 domain-containing protein n=1 Tax=Haloprofundus salilacus TaxID=2876190 RepID=UPI001CCDCC33|nr:DUF2267 domain-containing protein [Haloprofundus salilacus]
MNFDEFTGHVQNRLELANTGESVRAVRATLTTLGERLQEGEAEDLAGPLPMEIDRYLLEADSGQRFGFDEFVNRVAEREGMTDPDDAADAAFHAQAIVALVDEVAPAGEMEDVRAQLPEEYERLFELTDGQPE